MKRTRRHHRRELKQEAGGIAVEHGYSCAAAGRSLGVSGALIGRWKDKLETHKAISLVPSSQWLSNAFP